MAKGIVDGAAQPRKKMRKKRKFLIALGVIARVFADAWALFITPAIDRFATEKIQSAGLEGATVGIHADVAKLILPALPSSIASSSVLKSKNIVLEFGGLGVDDIDGLMKGAESSKLVLHDGTYFTITAQVL